MINKCKTILLTASLLFSSTLFAVTIDITKRGAKGDGVTDNTVVIQKAVDECSAKGGGTVLVPSGTYLIRPIELKSNVNLHLDFGALVLGSTRLADYDHAFPYKEGSMNQSSGLLFARGQKNISLTGFGTIDGQGGSETFQFGNDGDGGPKRPKLIYLVECQGIVVTDLTLRNSAYWVQHYERCEDVTIRGLKVFSHCNYNNDGLDIDAKNATISDCYIDVEDDAICFKSDHPEFCENITVTNCVTASNCNAIKFGTASHGGYRNIAVSNCVVRRAAEDNIRHWSKQLEHISAEVTVISGVAIEMVDGGIIDGITVSNISMRDVQTPIFIRLGDRHRTFRKEGGVLKNINISNIVATAESLIACSITGVENSFVENVSINNVQVSYPGGGTTEMLMTPVPEEVSSYPENRMFGNTLPAAGFYVRHARNVRFNNVRFCAEQPDARPLFFLDDVVGAEFNQCKGVAPADSKFIRTVRSCDIVADGKYLSK
ncbi:glycoside hydrolase family 28 protein [Bacteroides nordii]|uniref:glycoside hydrolase family 28 protein n=1 Tax=Bacteroides nordii TaxID=291645 RepID=UPI0034A2B393